MSKSCWKQRASLPLTSFDGQSQYDEMKGDPPQASPQRFQPALPNKIRSGLNWNAGCRAKEPSAQIAILVND
jgi:hypothetical protein